MESVKKFFAELPEKIRKMTPKQIVCTVMCVLLITVVILTCVVIGKVSRIFRSADDPKETIVPTESTGMTTEPTTEPSSEPTTQPTIQTEPGHVHEFVLTESVDATCENYGYNIYTCACGKQDIPLDEQTEPLGHSYGAGEVIAPTCTENGCTKYTCSRCGDVMTTNTVAATGHSYEITEEVESTCGVQGHIISTCTLCGDVVTEYVGEILEHTYEIIEQHSVTCTEDGYIVYKCINCGSEHTDDVQTATGHSFSSWSQLADGSWVRTCTNDGCTLQETSADLKIQKDQSGAVPDSSGNPYKLYMVYVGTDSSPDLFLYTINDFLDNGTLHYTYDTAKGLIITYTTGSGSTVTLTQEILKSAEVSIPAEQVPTEPVPEPSTSSPPTPEDPNIGGPADETPSEDITE